MNQIQTFRAPDMESAMRIVRESLGLDAVVLESREIPHRRLFPWSKPRIEIEVSACAQGYSETNNPSRMANLSTGLDLESLDDASPQTRPVDSRESKTVHETPEKLSALDDRLNSIQNMLAQIGHRQIVSDERDVPIELFDLYTELLDAELDESLARDLVGRLKRNVDAESLEDPVRSRVLLNAMVERELHCTGSIRVVPEQRKVVALIGPTGVGKTTTIAKLAANFRLRDGIRMGLVTVDTYRIAAVEQLRTYAEIIDLPMRVVVTPEEMRNALDEFSDMDLVLIDTAGRSPRDEVKLQELKSLFGAAHVDEIHLVMSLTASLKSMTSTVRSFRGAGATSLLLTKLDEAESLGDILSLCREFELPISYLTTGQNVPDDIEPSESARLARLILGQDRVGRD
ncbi:MAG TPA: flagellar biosynthesis protein FlhF [Planctomycetaceae bacterium]|nr:flagellar biosynthesis protein FlhF [Planctomycetaceae bacterium]